MTLLIITSKVFQRVNVMAYLRAFIIMFGLIFGASNSFAATLNDLQFTELPGERIEVRATFSEPPSQPKGYAIEQPARIVLDFDNVDSSLPQKKYPLSFGNAQSAVVLEAGNRTRFIMNLTSPSTYSTSIEGNTLIAIIDGSKGNKAYVRQKSTSTNNQSFTDKSERRITKVDFRRTENGGGTVLLNISNPKVSVDIEKSASGIVVNFSDTNIAANLQRRLDVLDFATPVKTIESISEGDNTTIAIDIVGEYDYLAYQADNQYVITVNSLTPAQAAARQDRFKFVGEKLSLNFQDIQVRAVLEIIADVTGLNLVASDTVQGNITLRLDNVPWDQALELVLKSKSLDKRLVGNVLLVAPAAEIAERERQEIETRNQLEELAPLRTEFIRIRYASASDIFELFKSSGSTGAEDEGSKSTAGILSNRGAAIVDERTNSIILTETESKITEFLALIEKLDVPIRQVLIESRIVIANSTFSKEIGVRWGGSAASENGGGLTTIGGSLDSLSPSLSGPANIVNSVNNNIVNLAAPNTAGTIALSFLNSNVLLDLELSAFESNGSAEIVSQPKVITGDKQQASIESGQSIPYQTTTDGEVSIEFEEAVLRLDVTPQITPDNRIIMDLIITQDSVAGAAVSTAETVPIIDTTELITQVLVADGQTIVLGGIYQQNSINTVDKVPFFGDIPYLGRLFKRNVSSNEKQELLIFITPRILSDTLISN
ncbi:MAG: type IV pilus assembly protein PilQ [Cellvibrionaceae bacterium]|jgi:type IV pilus assembly protein PilQ